MNSQFKVPLQMFVAVLFFVFTSISAICQSKPNYQVGTIMEVHEHHANVGTRSDTISYDVSVRVGDTIYVALYTPPLGLTTVKYAAGRNLLVVVGEKTITYNDILGHSFEVPILTQRLISAEKQAH